MVDRVYVRECGRYWLIYKQLTAQPRPFRERGRWGRRSLRPFLLLKIPWHAHKTSFLAKCKIFFFPFHFDFALRFCCSLFVCLCVCVWLYLFLFFSFFFCLKATVFFGACFWRYKSFKYLMSAPLCSVCVC